VIYSPCYRLYFRELSPIRELLCICNWRLRFTKTDDIHISCAYVYSCTIAVFLVILNYLLKSAISSICL